MAACPSCGFENAATAKFCSECGAGIADAATHREERKVVSVVFVDLVGSTARAESSDPEDVRALLRVYHERARDELESYGGTVEKFMGDAVVAVFGAPVAHEDDPERAVRAALAVRDAVARLNDDEPGRDLHVRIAVNTGEALVTLDASPREGEAMVAGDVVNTAARLQSVAPVDGILVGEQTHRATERAIAYRDATLVEAKGKELPVPAYEAVEPRSRLGVDLGGAGRAPLVGRDEELQQLAATLQRAREDRATQLVTIVGVPGIGKSRLLYELGRLADEDEELITWRQGRSLPYGEGVSFWALGEIVKAHAGILESDSAEATAAKLQEAVAVLPDESERTWVERHLRPLVGLSGDEIAAGDRRGEAFAAWRRFLESVAEGGPTVLVFEDLHWADDGMLDFVDGLVDWVDRVPLLVACTARPELLDRRPEWGARKPGAGIVMLAPLDSEQTARLVHTLLERPLLDAATQQALVERSAGNPLYAEEFVRMLDEGGVLEEFPETVQGIVSARIDLLPVEEKELLQRAAVLGKVFWSDALAALGKTDQWQLTGRLRSLERKEFIRREQRSAVAGASQHAFVHALVRDTAYGQLPRAQRAARHLAAAEWIESLSDDRTEDRAEMLAHHYVTAIDLLRAAGEDVGALGPRIVGPLHEAGERALSLCAYHMAAGYLARALELVPEDDEPSPDLLLAAGKAFGFVGRGGDELERAVAAFAKAGDVERAAEAAVMASWHGWHSGQAGSDEWLDRATALVEGRPPSRAKALVLAERARKQMITYQYDTATVLADAAIELARKVAEDEILADALVTRGICAVGLGDRDGIDLIEKGLALAGHRGRVASRGYVNLYVGWLMLGDSRRGRDALEQGLERALNEGDEQGAWFLRGNLIGLRFNAGDWDEALELAAALANAGESFRYMESAARGIRGLVLDARGAADAALDEIRSGLELARRAGESQSLWPALITLARMTRRRGLQEESERAIEEVLSGLESSESAGDPQEWHIELILELVGRGQHESATRLVERLPDVPWRDVCAAILGDDYAVAADIAENIGVLPIAAEIRLEAARSLAAEGRFDEAERQIELARAFFRRVDATACLREADEILAAAS